MLGQQPEGPDDLCAACHHLTQSGLIYSAGGNASVRVGDVVYITPTGGVLGRMQPADLVQTTLDGVVCGGGVPSKELGMHLALYRARPAVRAVVHPHPAAAIAWSMRQPAPGLDAIPATNAGFYIRAGQAPLLPYFPSGSRELHEAVAHLATDFAAVLLGNHGVIAGGATLLDAINSVEEIEQNCHILLLAGAGARLLTDAQRAAIDAKLGRAWPDPACYVDWFATLS